jgi:hypothetical protein
MKTSIKKTIVIMLAASAVAGSALADPAGVTPSIAIETLGSTNVIPNPSVPEIPIPVQFERFGALPHPGAAFAPFDTFRTVSLEQPVAFQMGSRF